MNIDDTKSTEDINCIQDMFNKHQILMEKYDKIEAENGAVVPESPYNLDDRKVQTRIKDMFWRVTEEISEALEAIYPNEGRLTKWQQNWETCENVRHFFEELADALHFLVEASILAELEPQTIEACLEEVRKVPKPDTCATVITRRELYTHAFEVTYWMGLAANDFKNKPWKQTEVPTDIARFKKHLTNVWEVLWDLFYFTKCKDLDIYSLYDRKNQVNKWRQDTKY